MVIEGAEEVRNSFWTIFSFALMTDQTTEFRFPAGKRPSGSRALSRYVFAVLLTVPLAFFANPALALSETTTVYGTTASILSANPGAFLPANSDLVCFSMNEGNCWDGTKWHQLYPSGRRHYVVSTTGRVACSVIVAPRNDCWTGSAWYRLPKGQVFGVIGSFFSRTPGAFITVPKDLSPHTYVSASWQSPLSQYASKR